MLGYTESQGDTLRERFTQPTNLQSYGFQIKRGLISKTTLAINLWELCLKINKKAEVLLLF